MSPYVPPDLCESTRPGRVAAVMEFFFTLRQARFLAHVLVFSGVFLERQYCAFAGIAHGQKTHDFLAKLVGGGYARVITPGALHRGQLFHVQFKPLYEAIGEPNNRHRKPASLGRFVERLMELDDGVSSRRRGDERLVEGVEDSVQARGTAGQEAARLPAHRSAQLDP